MTAERRPSREIDGKGRTVRDLHRRLAEQISTSGWTTQEAAP